MGSGSAIGVIAWPIRKRKKRWRGRYGVGVSFRPWWRACVKSKLELIDGFKRFAAARQVRELTTLSVRVLEVDERRRRRRFWG